MRLSINKGVLIATILAAATLGAGCARVPPAGKLSVVATIYPLAFFAQEIGGDSVDVQLLTPSGVEPHDWEPSPRDLVSITKASVLVFNGAGLEPWMDRLRPALGAAGPLLVETVEGLPLRQAATGEQTSGRAAGETDPHVWLDPELAKRQVDAIRTGLERSDPANSSRYQQRAQALKDRLDTLQQRYREGLRACRIRAFVTVHQAFSYLAQRFGLEEIPIAGLSPDASPSPARLAELARLLRERQIRVVFFEELASPAVADTLAREVGARTMVLNPLEGLSPEQQQSGADYFKLMDSNLANLRQALECR